jgi:hypothetical protein
MYVCQTEFDFMPVWAALSIFQQSYLVPILYASIVIVAFKAIVKLFVNVRAGDNVLMMVKTTTTTTTTTTKNNNNNNNNNDKRNNKKNNSNNTKNIDQNESDRDCAAMMFALIQFVGFSIYAITVERFSVLMMPSACVLASTLCSTNVATSILRSLPSLARHSSSHNDRQTSTTLATTINSIGALLIALLLYANEAGIEALWLQHAIPLGAGEHSQAALLEHIRAHTPLNASFAASMPTASAIRFVAVRFYYSCFYYFFFVLIIITRHRIERLQCILNMKMPKQDDVSNLFIKCMD